MLNIFARGTFITRLYIGMIVIVIIPIIIIAFTRSELVYQNMTKKIDKELISLATYLAKELPGTFEQILIEEGAEQAPDAEKIKVLNHWARHYSRARG